MTHGAHPIVIRGQTALRATRWERRVHGCLTWDAVDADEQERVFRQATCLASFIDFEELERLGILQDDEVLEIAVSPGAKRNSCACVSVRHITHLGHDAIMRIRANIYILSPVALVLDLAREHTLSEMLALIEELTGNWSLPERNSEDDKEDPDIDFIDKQCGYYESEPATTIDDLTEYHSQSARAAGRKAAQTAIMYATGSSRSPMEAIVYAMFSLPHMLGGLNCGPIKPNFKIAMQGNAGKLSGLPYVVADAYLPNFNSILEYNGSYHDESSVRRRDEARTLGLMCIGIDVYRLNDLQLNDSGDLESVARIIYRRNGLTYRPRAKQYDKRLPLLLKELRRALGLDDHGAS